MDNNKTWDPTTCERAKPIPKPMTDEKSKDPRSLRSLKKSDVTGQQWTQLETFCAQTRIPIESFYYDPERENGIMYDAALSLNGNPEVVAFPNNLRIKGYLDISGCTKLESLPETLQIDGGLYADNMEELSREYWRAASAYEQSIATQEKEPPAPSTEMPRW